MFRIHRSLTLVLMVLVAALISAPAFAQGASNSSISGIVVDCGRRRHPRRHRHRHQRRHGRQVDGRLGRQRHVHDSRPDRRQLHRDRRASGIQDRGAQGRRPSPPAPRPRCRPRSKSAASPRPSSSKARPRSSRRSRRPRPRRSTRTRSRACRSASAQHARLRHVPAGRADAGRQPRLDRQRPAAELASTSRLTASACRTTT